MQRAASEWKCTRNSFRSVQRPNCSRSNVKHTLEHIRQFKLMLFGAKRACTFSSGVRVTVAVFGAEITDLTAWETGNQWLKRGPGQNGLRT